jgi:translocator protein
MGKIAYLKLTWAIVICLIIGLIGYFFSSTSIDNWYHSLSKPLFAPSDTILAWIWIILYSLMGVSLFYIWRKKSFSLIYEGAISSFRTQLLLSILWNLVFFYFRSPFWAFIEILLLWLAILTTVIFFYFLSKKAAFLLIPYFLWVTYMAVFNFCIYHLNR